MSERHYMRLQDVPLSKVDGFLTPYNQITDSLYGKCEGALKQINVLLENYKYSTRGRKDYSIYTGYTGLALAHFIIYKRRKDSESFETAKELTEMALTKLTGQDVSFLTGDAGPLALATVLYALDDNNNRSSECRLWLLHLGQNASSNISCALIDGWAGYLYALLFVNKHLPGSIPGYAIRKVVSRILREGVNLTIQKRRSSPPLSFEWKGVNYLGALYGVCGILYMLLVSDAVEESELYSLVRPTLEALVSQKREKGTFPYCEGGYDDDLIQWCHGPPGYVPLFIKASEVFDPSYMKYAIEAGEATWRLGVLKKGLTLCHGVSGNAYSFLALFRKTGDRKFMLRTANFFDWCTHWPRYEAIKPDRPFSLFKGYTSILYFLNDIKDVNNAAFPGYEL